MDTCTADELQTDPVSLASFGDILCAYTAMRAGDRRRRCKSPENEMLPWSLGVRNAAAQFEKDAPSNAHGNRHDREVHGRHHRSDCQCGKCRAGQENARWERIFQEKFADPDYYLRPAEIRVSSPLARP